MLLLLPLPPSQGHLGRLGPLCVLVGGVSRPRQEVPRAGSSVTILLCDFGQLTDPLWASRHHLSRDVWTVPGGPARMADLGQLQSSQWVSHQHFSASLRVTSPTPQATARGVLRPQPVWLGRSSCLWDRLPFACGAEGIRGYQGLPACAHLWHQLPAQSGANLHPEQRSTEQTPSCGVSSGQPGLGRGAGALSEPAWERATLARRRVLGSEEMQTLRGAWGRPGSQEGQRMSLPMLPLSVLQALCPGASPPATGATECSPVLDKRGL